MKVFLDAWEYCVFCEVCVVPGGGVCVRVCVGKPMGKSFGERG